MNYKNSQKGFTLVELAIVLVIIGLIVSSVLVGQDLVKAAELRSLVKQYQEYQAGVNTFIGKYGKIPGDIHGAKFGLAGSAGYQDNSSGDGDENGLITATGSATAITTLTGEISTFWSHLTTSNKEMISGSYDGNGGFELGVDMPELKTGGFGWGVFGVGQKNYFIAGVKDNDAAYDTGNVFVPLDAFNIDDKIDDGVPTTGTVQSRAGGDDTPNTDATTNSEVDNTVCNNTDTTPDEYQFTADTRLCTLIFEMATF